MASLFEAYVTNLGKYNEGELVGETLKFPTTTEEVQALLKRIGVDGVRYEEFFITSFDGDVLGLYDYLTEYENLDELNHLACLLSELDKSDLEKFEAAVASGEHTSGVGDLINLVENLLAVTRIEDGRMNLRMETELVSEVISEALRHVSRQSVEHSITAESTDDFLLARMDARLIVQVIINLVDNAIKYTQKGSRIQILTDKLESDVRIRVTDDGPGIPDEAKPFVFDMCYTGANRIADSRRSLGLGLCLCRSIIRAHGGEISVSDNTPSGCIFTFTLPCEEVTIHE